MKITSVQLIGALLSSLSLAVTIPSQARDTPTTRDLQLAKEQAEKLIDSIRENHLNTLRAKEAKLRKRGEEPTCTAENVVFRREYGSLYQEEKLEYINAVKCLQSLPARTPASVAAGAVSRFDDFIVTHIQQTLTIHYTGNFMPWHRWFVYLYEKALRDECGYTGYQPYWDWPRYAEAPEKSPIFDGSPYSMGGNGEYIPHNGTVILPPENTGGAPLQLAPGVGGGFVTTGPFANLSVTLGPVGGVAGVEPGPDGGLGYNPRFLKRDVGPALNMRYANWTTVLDQLATPNIEAYRILSEGVPYTPEIGPHGGIHYVINGDPGGDLFTSPGDPVFWLHHSMMDRMWALWQTLDPETRYVDLDAGAAGHLTWLNEPPSAKTTLDDIIDMGYAGESITIGEVMDTMSGPFCYFYL